MGNVHFHINVPDLDPGEHVNLNKLPQARKTIPGKIGNRLGPQNIAGFIL